MVIQKRTPEQEAQIEANYAAARAEGLDPVAWGVKQSLAKLGKDWTRENYIYHVWGPEPPPDIEDELPREFHR
jgi:hypothetical protein